MQQEHLASGLLEGLLDDQSCFGYGYRVVEEGEGWFAVTSPAAAGVKQAVPQFGQVPDKAGGAGSYTADTSGQVVDQSEAAVSAQAPGGLTQRRAGAGVGMAQIDKPS